MAAIRSKPGPSGIGGDITFLPMEAVGDRGGFDRQSVRRAEEVAAGHSYFEEGDVIRARVTPCFENGKGAVLDGLVGGRGFGSTELLALRPLPGVDRRFLYYVVTSHGFTHRGAGSLYGAHGVKRVPERFFQDTSAWAPTLQRQRAVADYLDLETARIDELIEKKKRHLALQQERFLAILDWSTGPIRGRARVRIRRLIRQITTGSRDWADRVGAGSGWFFRSMNLREGRSDAFVEGDRLAAIEPPDNAEARRAALRAGDILIGVTGANVGWVCHWQGEVSPVYVSQHVAAVRPLENVDSRWLAYALLSPSVRGQIRACQYGGTKQGLGLGEIRI